MKRSSLEGPAGAKRKYSISYAYLMDYKVDLDTFRGPLDLLLYLVKHNEVDLSDIPIARILEQFLHHLEAIKVIDVEGAGEFLVMAATLMEIKSKMLLPRNPDEEGGEEDPRLELVKQLIEYKKYKEAATLLEEQARRQMVRLARIAPEPAARPDLAQQPLRRVELWDLVSAFGRLMRETAALEARPIVMDETPMHVHMERIAELVRERGRVAFREVFTPPHVRGRLLGMFLAILELIKGCRVAAEQEQLFGEIWLCAPPLPRAAE
jgi:segregation and condensation protein A